MPEELIRGRELAQKIYTQITRHPESHNQEVWINQASRRAECGTQACVAGWAVTFNFPDGTLDTSFVIDPEHYRARSALADRLDVRDRSYYTLAKHLLGLNHGEACDLFHGDGFNSDTDDETWEQYAAEWLRNRFDLEGNA